MPRIMQFSLSALRRAIVQAFALIAVIFGPIAFGLHYLGVDLLGSGFALPSSVYLAWVSPILLYFAFRRPQGGEISAYQNGLNAFVIGAVIILGGIADTLPGQSLAGIYPVFLAAVLLVLTGWIKLVATAALLLLFPFYALFHLAENVQFELAVRGLASSLLVLITIELWLRHGREIDQRRGRFVGNGILVIALCPLVLYLFNTFGPNANPTMATDSALGFVALLITGLLARWRSNLPEALRWGLAGFAVVGFITSLIISGDFALPVANITIAICFLMIDRIDAAIASLLSIATLLVVTSLGVGIPTDHAFRSVLFSSMLTVMLFSASVALDLPQNLTNVRRLSDANRLFIVRFLQFVLPTLSLLTLVLVPIEFHLHGLGQSYTLTGTLQPILYIPLLLGLPFIATSGWLFARGAVSELNLERKSAELERQIATANLAMDVARFGLLEYDADIHEVRHLAGSAALFKDRVWRSIDLYYDQLGVDKNVRSELAFAYENPGESVDFRIHTKAGDEAWMRIAASKPYEHDGRRLQRLIWSNISREVKTKQKLEANYHQAQFLVQRLEAQQERERRLFAVIGHELRTPAAALKMLQDDQNIRELQPHGAKIVETTEHLLSVLDDLRAVTKPESALKSTVTFGHPYQEIQKAISSLEQLIKSSGMQVELSADEGTDIKLEGNFQGLRQIVTNLIKNAVLHSGAKNLRLTLSKTNSSASGKCGLKLSVCDDGKGISEAVQSKLFEAFYRGDTDADGTGLGLHLSRDLAQQLGGDLVYHPDFQPGACFILTWEMDLLVEPAETVPAKPLSLAGKRVLFAEDNLTISMLTTAILKKLGAEVVSGNNGQKAFEQFEPGQFDLIITDIFMPEMDGYQLTEAVRKIDAEIPIVGVTAATVGSEVEELMARGASTVIGKPLSVEKLAAALEHIGFK